MSDARPNRSVLITGASKGIGKACTEHLVTRGYRVFAGVRTDADAHGLVTSLGKGVVPVLADVTNPRQVEDMVETIRARSGEYPLAGVVSNAGVAVLGPLEFLPADRLRNQLEINVVGAVRVVQSVLPLLRQTTGRVVFMGSIAGRSSLPMAGAYGASKFALEAVADTMRVELAPAGIHVAIVEPGVISTPIWETATDAWAQTRSEMEDEVDVYYGSWIRALLRRAEAGVTGGQPSDVARVVEHALTASRPRARYVVGRDARMRLWLERLPWRLRDRLIRKGVERA